jgi:transposase
MMTGSRPRRDFEALEARRMKAAAMFRQGLRQADVHHRLKVSRTTAQRWYGAWRANGREGLKAAGRAGRKPRLGARQQDRIVRVLLQGAAAQGYGSDLWTLPRVAEVIRRETGIRYHPGHVWRILRQVLGWSLQRPARQARERDERAVRGWVRTTWPQVKKKPAAGGRGSHSSTRAG